MADSLGTAGIADQGVQASPEQHPGEWIDPSLVAAPELNGEAEPVASGSGELLSIAEGTAGALHHGAQKHICGWQEVCIRTCTGQCLLQRWLLSRLVLVGKLRAMRAHLQLQDLQRIYLNAGQSSGEPLCLLLPRSYTDDGCKLIGSSMSA